MKLIIKFFIALIMFFTVSCTKEPIKIVTNDSVQLEEIDNVYALIMEIEPSLNYSEIQKIKGTQSIIYDINDVLTFLAFYGYEIPNIVPAYNNYYQDINIGGSRLGQLSIINGQPFINNNGVLLNDTLKYSFDWYINDVFQCSEANPRLWDFDENLICDGVVELKLRIIHNQLGFIYERTQWAYLDYNYIQNCNCIGCPLPFEVFYAPYPNVDSYFFQVECATFDFNCNQIIDSFDLLTLLANFG